MFPSLRKVQAAKKEAHLASDRAHKLQERASVAAKKAQLKREKANAIHPTYPTPTKQFGKKFHEVANATAAYRYHGDRKQAQLSLAASIAVAENISPAIWKETEGLPERLNKLNSDFPDLPDSWPNYVKKFDNKTKAYVLLDIVLLYTGEEGLEEALNIVRRARARENPSDQSSSVFTLRTPAPEELIAQGLARGNSKEPSADPAIERICRPLVSSSTSPLKVVDLLLENPNPQNSETCHGGYTLMGGLESFADEKRRGVQNLPEEFLHTLTLLVFAGGSAPENFLMGNTRQWSSNGEIVTSSPGLSREVLDKLEREGFIYSMQDKVRIYFANPIISDHILKSSNNPRLWRSRVISAVAQSFPKSRYMDPLNFAAIGRTMIPCFIVALSYTFQGAPVEDVDLFIEVCLSASLFGPQAFKRLLIDTADLLTTNSKLSKVRVEARRTSLARAYGWVHQSSLNMEEIEIFSRSDHRWKAVFGEALLSQAKTLIHAGKSTAEVEDVFKKFRLSSAPSTLERHILADATLLTAISLRFEGRFQDASDKCQTLFNTHLTGQSISSHWSEIQCELKNCSAAINFLLTDYVDLAHEPSSTNGRRVRFSLANAHLMAALWAYPRLELRHLETARTLFMAFCPNPCSANVLAQHRHFTAFAGLGMIHLVHSQWEEAWASWEKAHDVLRCSAFKNNYSETLVLYAKSLILCRLKRNNAKDLERCSRQNFHGRDYHFAGQGTVWVDVLGDMAQECGLQRITPRLPF